MSKEKKNPIVVNQIRLSTNNDIDRTVNTDIKLKDAKSINPFKKLIRDLTGEDVDLTYKWFNKNK